ncbi:MAG: ADP-ribosylglycohydrolase family protein [Stenomitos frigidus ULC029]
MRHSLLSRFQGTLLAAALGQELGTYGRSRQCSPKSRTDHLKQIAWLTAANLSGWHPGLEPESALSRQPSVGGRLAVSCARALVNPDGWNDRVLAAIGGDALSGAETGIATEPYCSDGTPSETIDTELTIAALPVALFFHDDPNRQQQQLLQMVKLWHGSPASEAGLLAVGYAIAQALQDRLEPQTLLPQTIAYLKQRTVNPTTPFLELIGTLELAQTLVEQCSGLYTAIEQLPMRQHQTSNEAIALAFYCFLSTPLDLRLTLLRAARCGKAAPVVAALAGALGGAYQGTSGLPLVWQLTTDMPLSWGIAASTLHELAAHLFAAWSGVYLPAQPTVNAAIAAPGIIRSR